jgi:hypothetical protein
MTWADPANLLPAMWPALGSLNPAAHENLGTAATYVSPTPIAPRARPTATQTRSPPRRSGLAWTTRCRTLAVAEDGSLRGLYHLTHGI